MSTKNVRVMTPKRFVTSKLSGKVSAEGFLSAHWDFLLGQEYLTPILEAYENKEVLPTPTVQMCQQAVLSHIMQLEVNKGVAKATTKKEPGTKVIRRKKDGAEVDESEVPKGRYEVTIMCKFYSRDGSCTIDVGKVKDGAQAIFHADSYNDALRIADRKLCDGGDTVYAVIINTHGRPIATNIQRDDAIARTFAPKSGPSTVRTGVSTSQLGFGIKAKNDRSHFSKG